MSSHPDYRVRDRPGARRELGFIHLVEGDTLSEGKLDLAAPGEAGLVLLDVKTSAIYAKPMPRRSAAHYRVQRDVYVAASEAIQGSRWSGLPSSSRGPECRCRRQSPARSGSMEGASSRE